MSVAHIITLYVRMYFAHGGYSEYPVVGVSWEQANAFANWRTDYLRRSLAVLRIEIGSESGYAFNKGGGSPLAHIAGHVVKAVAKKASGSSTSHIQLARQS